MCVSNFLPNWCQWSLFQCWFCFEKVKWTRRGKTKQNKQTNIISNNNKHHIKTTVHKKSIFVADVAVVSCFSWILSGSSLIIIIIIYICTLTHEIHRVRRLSVCYRSFSATRRLLVVHLHFVWVYVVMQGAYNGWGLSHTYLCNT